MFHQQAQIGLPSHTRMMILMFVLGIAPNSCRGACATTHLPRCHFPSPKICIMPTVTLIIVRSILFNTGKSIDPTLRNTLQTPLQRSRRNPKWSSKVPLTHASNFPNNPRRTLARTVRTDRSGSGTCQASPT